MAVVANGLTPTIPLWANQWIFLTKSKMGPVGVDAPKAIAPLFAILHNGIGHLGPFSNRLSNQGLPSSKISQTTPRCSSDPKSKPLSRSLRRFSAWWYAFCLWDYLFTVQLNEVAPKLSPRCRAVLADTLISASKLRVGANRICLKSENAVKLFLDSRYEFDPKGVNKGVEGLKERFWSPLAFYTYGIEVKIAISLFLEENKCRNKPLISLIRL
jgi:hypothetical protein